ncbi:MAG: dipeptide epimerase [Gammaproteobacteria bacterium]|nr:dipeptide epimerase [Gammaproteobacteria bacterium]
MPDHEAGETVEQAEQQLHDFLTQYDLSQLAIQTIWQQARSAKLTAPAQAALDMALWDLLAKIAQLPCYQLFGLAREAISTSITIGIMSPEQAEARAMELLQTHHARALKIKLGSPAGIAADQAMFAKIKQVADNYPVKLLVDANGGWSLTEAKTMMAWLAQRGVEYVEQPLEAGSEDQLAELYHNRPLPIFVDESCRISSDVAGLVGKIDGINIKLMKCGGLSEALRLVAVARAHRLKTMIGCMSESSVAISAACALAPLIDYIDLDSHLNIKNDPATGMALDGNGQLLMVDKPGHGAELNENVI